MRGNALVLTRQPEKDDELISVVLIDLWSLAAARHVFKGEWVKVKLLADAGNFLRSGVNDIDPDRGLLVSDEFAQILEASLRNRPVRTGVHDYLDHGSSPRT